MYMELDTMDILSTMMLFYGQAKLKTSKIVQPSLLEATVPNRCSMPFAKWNCHPPINPGSNLRFFYLTILALVASRKHLILAC